MAQWKSFLEETPLNDLQQQKHLKDTPSDIFPFLVE